VHALKVVDDDAIISSEVLLPCLESERFVVHGTGTADRSSTAVDIAATTTTTNTNMNNISSSIEMNSIQIFMNAINEKGSQFLRIMLP